MYVFRSRDRRLMEQTARDISLTLQRDYRTFNPKKTLELSTRQTIYTGYITDSQVPIPNVTWEPLSEVAAAFGVLQQLLTQLMRGTYQQGSPAGAKNPGTWPVQTINWVWIQSLYAYINPAYKAYLAANNIVVPDWLTAP